MSKISWHSSSFFILWRRRCCIFSVRDGRLSWQNWLKAVAGGPLLRL